MNRTAVTIAVVAAFAFAACSASDDAAGGPSSTTAPASEPTSASPTDAETSPSVSSTSPDAPSTADTVRSVLDDDHLFDPDDLRGDAATLDEAVSGIGWPVIDDMRGTVIVALNNAGSERDLYIARTPVLEGRAMFTSSTPGAPDAAFVRFEDPTSPGLDDAARDGYLIRTRTDEPTVDARDDDTTTRDIALASGAQYLSTDYYEPSTLFDSAYVVSLPGGAVARCNPVTARVTCRDDHLTESAA